MAWIELHDTLPDHPKTIAASSALKMDKDMLVGKLCRLWTWCLNHRENGFVADYEMETVAEIMRWTKKPEALFDALCTIPQHHEHGFMEKVDGGYIIHDWDERVEMLRQKREEARAKTRARVRNYRQRQATEKGVTTKDNDDTCNALQGRYETQDETRCYAATVPNHTVPSYEEEETCVRAREDEAEPPTSAAGYCRENLLAMTTGNMAELRDLLADDRMPEDVIRYAVDEACAHGGRTWSYVRTVLNRWIVAGVRTVGEAKAASEQYGRGKGEYRAGAPPRQVITPADDAAMRRFNAMKTVT